MYSSPMVNLKPWLSSKLILRTTVYGVQKWRGLFSLVPPNLVRQYPSELAMECPGGAGATTQGVTLGDRLDVITTEDDLPWIA